MQREIDAAAALLGTAWPRRAAIAALAVAGLGCHAAVIGAQVDEGADADGEVDATAGKIDARTPWRRTGDTTPHRFRRDFSRLDSPMLVEAERIYRRVRGLSRLYLAMSYMEKKHDTYTRIIPQSSHNALAVKRPNGRWERYPSYATGAARWVDLLTDPHGPYAETRTLRDLISVYAPPFENDVDRYLAVITRQMNRYPSARR